MTFVEHVKTLSCVLTVALISFLVEANQFASAEESYKLIKTEDPRQYVEVFMNKIDQTGVPAARALFDELKLRSPQSDATFSMFETVDADEKTRWATVMGQRDLGGALRHVYSYVYMGANIWVYWRFDFVRTSDEEWAISNVYLNTDPQQILPSDFGEVIQ